MNQWSKKWDILSNSIFINFKLCKQPNKETYNYQNFLEIAGSVVKRSFILAIKLNTGEQFFAFPLQWRSRTGKSPTSFGCKTLAAT